MNSNYLNKMPLVFESINLEEKFEISKSSCSIYCAQWILLYCVCNRSEKKLIHTEICGLVKVLFFDDYLRLTFVYFLKNKRETLGCFRDLKNKAEIPTDKRIKYIRSDNDLVLCNREFNFIFQKEGITYHNNNIYSSEQNGSCERPNHTIVEK